MTSVAQKWPNIDGKYEIKGLETKIASSIAKHCKMYGPEVWVMNGNEPSQFGIPAVTILFWHEWNSPSHECYKHHRFFLKRVGILQVKYIGFFLRFGWFQSQPLTKFGFIHLVKCRNPHTLRILTSMINGYSPNMVGFDPTLILSACWSPIRAIIWAWK